VIEKEKSIDLTTRFSVVEHTDNARMESNLQHCIYQKESNASQPNVFCQNKISISSFLLRFAGFYKLSANLKIFRLFILKLYFKLLFENRHI
jgi:hypothetical protein